MPAAPAYDASVTTFDPLPKDGDDPAREAARGQAATADGAQPDAPELDLLRLQRGAGNAVVSRWLARQEVETATEAASAGAAAGAKKDPAERTAATLTMDEVGAGIPLGEVRYGDPKRVSFTTFDTRAGQKLFGLLQTSKAVPKAELAIGSSVLALADVRVASVTVHQPSETEPQGKPVGESYFEVTLVAAKASTSGGKAQEKEAPDSWEK